MKKPRRVELENHPVGSGYGQTVLHALLGETLEEAGLKKRTIGVSSVRSLFLLYDFLDVDFASAPPGLAPAVATGLKRARPEAMVFSYQSPVDVMGPGLGVLLDVVGRQEPLTLLIVSDEDRPDVDRIKALVRAGGSGCRHSRTRLDSVESLKRVKRALKSAFTHPLKSGGTTVLEVDVSCPSTWDLPPGDARRLIDAAFHREALAALAAGGKHS